MRSDYLINEHPVLLNAFIDRTRSEWAKLNLFDSSHCEDKTGVNLEGKILVVSPSRMNDKYKTPEDQLFMATKQSFCSDVFNGRLFPFEMLCANNERYNKARNKYKEKETLLLNVLNDEQTTLYEKAQDCYTECQIAQTEQAFKMGLKYAFEMLEDLKDIEFIKEIE